MTSKDKFDVALIGGGVIGCSVLFDLTNQGYACVLLEKEDYLLTGASCGNSGMLHTGFDAPLNSVELSCIKKNQQRIFELLEKLELPCKKNGVKMVAWNEKELEKLPEVQRKSFDVGIEDVTRLSLSQLHQMEPHLSYKAKGAIYIPGEAVIDPWLTPTMLAHHSKTRGAAIKTNTMVQSLERDDYGNWDITTINGHVKASAVINCAGLYGDIVDKLSDQQTFKIKPRKGQYIVYRKPSRPLVNSSIVPVPTEMGKGVILVRSVYDNIAVGPTAEDVDSRLIPQIDPVVTRKLSQLGDTYLPGLSSNVIACMYTGVRPATEYKDYQIKFKEDRYWITLGGIRSTGVSGCLGISNMVKEIVKDKFNLEPSSASYNTLEKILYTYDGHGIVTIGNQQYKISHPMMRAGFDDGHNMLSSL